VKLAGLLAQAGLVTLALLAPCPRWPRPGRPQGVHGSAELLPLPERRGLQRLVRSGRGGHPGDRM